MTSNWLVELAPAVKTVSQQEVHPAPVVPTPHLDLLFDKLAVAKELGQELAHKNPNLIKQAMMPGLGSLAKTVGKTMVRNPTKALTVGGAGAGAIGGALKDPGTDPNTGQAKSRLGNMAIGAGLGAAAGHMAGKLPGVQNMAKSQGQNVLGQARQGRMADRASRLATAKGRAGVPSAGAVHPPTGGGVPTPPAVNPAAAEVAAHNGGMKGFTSNQLGDEHINMGGGVKTPASQLPRNAAGEYPAIRKNFWGQNVVHQSGIEPSEEKIASRFVKKALALGGLGRKALSLVAKHPTATLAAAGAGAGAIAGGPDHRLGGAVAGGALGAGASKIPQVAKLMGRGAAGEASVAKAVPHDVPHVSPSSAVPHPPGGTQVDIPPSAAHAPTQAASIPSPPAGGVPQAPPGATPIAARPSNSGAATQNLNTQDIHFDSQVAGPQHGKSGREVLDNPNARAPLEDLGGNAPWHEGAEKEWGAHSQEHSDAVKRFNKTEPGMGPVQTQRSIVNPTAVTQARSPVVGPPRANPAAGAPAIPSPQAESWGMTGSGKPAYSNSTNAAHENFTQDDWLDRSRMRAGRERRSGIASSEEKVAGVRVPLRGLRSSMIKRAAIIPPPSGLVRRAAKTLRIAPISNAQLMASKAEPVHNLGKRFGKSTLEKTMVDAPAFRG